MGERINHRFKKLERERKKQEKRRKRQEAKEEKSRLAKAEREGTAPVDVTRPPEPGA